MRWALTIIAAVSFSERVSLWSLDLIPAFSQAVGSGFPPELGASFAVCFSIQDAVIA